MKVASNVTYIRGYVPGHPRRRGSPGLVRTGRLSLLQIGRTVGTMAAHLLSTTLDPVDPAVRSGAKVLADRIVGDTPVEAAVRAMLDDVAQGARVVVLRAEDEVTPAEAAEILGVTRQFVDRLCEDGALPFRRLPGSRHRRIRVQDAVDLATEREQRRSGAEAVRAALGE